MVPLAPNAATASLQAARTSIAAAEIPAVPIMSIPHATDHEPVRTTAGATIAEEQALMVAASACVRPCPRGTLPDSLPEERKDAVRKFVMLSRTGAALAALIIIVLSVVPGNMRPHVLGNDYGEHFVAYFFTGGLLAIGHQRPMQLLSRGVLLTLCAGSLEFVQLWIPSRIASAGEFATSTIGVWIGLLVVVVVRRVHKRKIAVSYK
jgi:hypothetical protein